MNPFINYIKSFCEIKDKSGNAVCSGYIKSVDEDNIVIESILVFSEQTNFDGVVTTLGHERGLQVFNVHVRNIAESTVFFDKIVKVTDTERRAAFRVSFDAFALVTTAAEPAISYDAFINDISVCGISLRLHKAFDIDDIIHIQFQIDGDTVHSCDCNIVRFIGNTNTSLRRYGCEFINLPEQSAAAVNALITKKRTEMMSGMLR